MFKLRDDQVDTLDATWRDDFHRRLAALYRQSIPQATAPLDEPTLLRRIAQADEKARGHGIRTERGIAQFVGLSLLNGPDFDEHPRIRSYLAMPGATPDEKMQLLVDRCAELERHAGGGAAHG
jgi:hypothetical protein